MTDFLPRTIAADAQGVGFVSVRGYGVEIIDGGVYGRENTLQLIRGEDGLFDGLAASDEVPCVSGVRMLGEFTGLRLVTPRTAPVLDRVKVRVLTAPNVTAIDAQPAGKSRARFLSRGSATIALGSWHQLWASADDGEFDRFSTEEQFDCPRHWFGWVGGRLLFRVYGFASSTVNPPGDFRCVLRGDAVDTKVAAGHPYSGGHFYFDFTTPSGSVNASAPPWPFPPGSVELWVFNPSGVNAVDIQWIFGVRG